MKTLLFLLMLLPLWGNALAQNTTTDYEQEILNFQQELNASYRDPKKTPLEPQDLQGFTELPFFPIDAKYRVVARVVRSKKSRPFKMATSTDRLPLYKKWGEVHFELDGRQLVLPVYQSLELRSRAGYEDYLFLPFKDLTNGKESYGGGRYLDLRIPQGDTLVIDFNKAYNPYCAYSSRYSCPIPPQENRLSVAIPAGVMASPDH